MQNRWYTGFTVSFCISYTHMLYSYIDTTSFFKTYYSLSEKKKRGLFYPWRSLVSCRFVLRVRPLSTSLYSLVILTLVSIFLLILSCHRKFTSLHTKSSYLLLIIYIVLWLIIYNFFDEKYFITSIFIDLIKVHSYPLFLNRC